MPASSAVAHRVGGFGPERVDDADEGDEDEILDAAIGSAAAASIAAPSSPFAGEREDAQALLGELPVGVEDLVAQVADRDDLAVSECAAAAVEDDVGAALHAMKWAS